MDFFPEVTQRSYEQARRNRRFINTLSAMRESKGISQELVARRLGTTAARIDELEGRGINPTLQELHSYAVAIGVAIEYNVRDLEAK